MNRAERRAAQHGKNRRGRGALGGLERQVERVDLSAVKLELLYDPQAKRLHAGPAKGPGPGRPLCERFPSLFQHPLFARDPNFSPGVKADLRHQYALAALQLNDGCADCIVQLHEIGEQARIDPEYPYLDPVKAEA